MELEKVLRDRWSVRDFKPEPIEEEKLNAVLEAGRLSPTAKNNQPQRVYVIKTPEGLEKIRAITRCAFNAPAVIMVAYDGAEMWENPLEAGVTSGREDAAIVATQMMLRAYDVGLGTCWVGFFPPTETARAFALPESVVPVMLLPIGYPADSAAPSERHSQRKPLTETVTLL